MLTKRAIWLVLIASLAFLGGILVRHEPIALCGFTLLVWVGMEWVAFLWRVTTATQVFDSVHRQWDGDARHTLVKTVDDACHATVTATPNQRLSGLRLWIEDVVPPGSEASTSPRIVGDVQQGTVLQWSYTLWLRRLGRVQLPGMHVRISDGGGLFAVFRFVPCRQEMTVLPLLVRPQSTVSILKPDNAQLLMGNHRYRRPGGSGELLSIRDYQSGDPPKTIAWKVSARLGRLMTCEYERETPVRATIISDLSLYQFVGRPGPAAADKVVSMAGSIARLLLTDRDPVANLIINGARRYWLPHGSGERQLTRMLHVLMGHLANQAVPPGIVFEDLLTVAWTTCQQRFPELLESRLNAQQGLIRLTLGGRRLRQRRQLAVALAQIYHGPLGYAHRLMEDRQEFSFACRQFLLDYPSDLIPIGVPPAQQLASARHTTLETVCRAIVESVARARDNELMVVIGALPGRPDEVDAMEKAVRLARAEYHRVVLLYCDPQPADVQMLDPDAKRILLDQRRNDVRKATEILKQRVNRLGAKVAEFSDPRLAEKIAGEVELLRSGRGRVQGGRS